MQQFVNNASKRSHVRSGPLTTCELQQDERCWLRVAQDQSFRAEIQFLLEHKPLPSSVLRLSPLLDQEGLLRVGGRLNLLNASTVIRHPLLWHGEHKFASLIIQATHARTLQGGVELTLTELRERFWVLKGRKTV